MADLEHDAAISPSTVFHAASLSKRFTAFATLIPAAEGELALDDDVRTYVPEVPDFGARLTLRHLLLTRCSLAAATRSARGPRLTGARGGRPSRSPLDCASPGGGGYAQSGATVCADVPPLRSRCLSAVIPVLGRGNAAAHFHLH
jgi:CubicO group peptidase (beta-lactamase class C family)